MQQENKREEEERKKRDILSELWIICTSCTYAGLENISGGVVVESCFEKR